MKIALGCDHGGYAMKEDIKKQLEGLGHEVKDCGTYSTESCDYPIFGEAAARAVASGECEYGIVVCTTGIGISIAANKVKGIRCAHCADALEAQLCRQHNNANMMAIGAGFKGRKALGYLKPTTIATVVKLMILPALFLPLAVHLGFTDEKLVALLVMLGSITTPACYVMAKQMGHEGVLTGSVCVTTTLFSAFSLTFWLFVLRSLGYIL